MDRHIYIPVYQAMSDIDNLGFYSEDEPMNTISFEDWVVFDNVLEDDTDNLVSILQSNSGLLNKFQSVKAVYESQDDVPIRPWNANLKEEKMTGYFLGESFKDPKDFDSQAEHQNSLQEVLGHFSSSAPNIQQAPGLILDIVGECMLHE